MPQSNENTTIQSSMFIKTDPMNYMEQVIQMKMINLMDKILSKCNKNNLLLFVLFFGADCAKQQCVKLINHLCSRIGKWASTLDFNRLLKKSIPERSIEQIEAAPVIADTSITIQFRGNSIFYENLFNYIESNANRCTAHEIDLSQIDKDTFERRFSLLIDLSFQDINVKFNDPIIYTSIISNNVSKFKQVDMYQPNCAISKNTKYKSVLDLIPFPQFTAELRSKLSLGNSIDRFEEKAHVWFPFTALITNLIHSQYILEESKWHTFKYLGYVFAIMKPEYDFSPSKTNNNHIVFWPSIITPGNSVVEFLGIPIYCTDLLPNPNSGYNILDIKLKTFPQAKELEAWLKQSLEQPVKKEITSCGNMLIRLSTKDQSATNESLRGRWLEFVNVINSESTAFDYASKKDNISIFDVKLSFDKRVITPHSPQKVIESNNNGVIEKTVIDEIKEVSSQILNIQCVKLNSTYKDFSTLYLKKKDDHVLSTILNNFKHKKSLYRDLGLPYKFGALLYGEPGTGKSSAILAIASYLQKDIYYVDFNNIKTNDDLKAVFSKINKEMANSGIIVMEDIDVMTPIVHDRSLNRHISSELTLDCFLNLLQGSLTNDGSVFIATTNDINILDPAFVRDGRFDAKIELSACDHFQFNKIYSKFFGRTIPEHLLRKIPEGTITPATFISKMVPYILTDVSDEEILSSIIMVE